MCRALKVLCVATDADALRDVKMAAVGASWELAPGAVDAEDALAQMGEGRPHIMVIFGEYGDLIAQARELYPGLRVIADTPAEGVDVVVASLEDVRPSILGAPKPSGPVRDA